MNKEVKAAVAKVVETLISLNARVATKFLDEKLVVRATRRTFKGKIQRGNAEIFVTIGKPNYLERDFIKKCRKAGEVFPVRKIQLKFPKK